MSRRRDTMTIGLVLWSLTAAVPADAQLAPGEAPPTYAECMALAHSRPAQALDRARAWAAAAGGHAAHHCAAVAQIGLGRYVEAAGQLEILAAEVDGPDAALRPRLLAQAGQVWLLAGDVARAQAAQTAALEADPDNVELLIDRSITLAQAGNSRAALDDLNRAVELAPRRADLLVLRASAYRRLDARALARDDIARALDLDPENPEALLERGLLSDLAGDPGAAKADLRRVIELAPDTPAAGVARANLERLSRGTQ